MKPFYKAVRNSFSYLFQRLYKHQVIGIENLPPGPALIAANHTSYYDPIIIAVSSQEEFTFIARAPLFRFRGFASAIKHLNAYPISGDSSDLTTFRLLYKLIGEGHKVVIFPEGARSFTGELMPFKEGLGMVALHCKVPIVPACIKGAFEIWPREQKFPKLKGKSSITFGKPIYPEAYSHLKRREAQEAIAHDVKLAIEALIL